ncbi:MAG: alkene reductase [Proteobacteria bacterium]|nr:alkene reductase [Pseudomonadota bacterium]
MSLLFSPTQFGALSLQNRLAMCPLTRCRAIDNVPNELMAEYYGQRAGVGLIITEGTSPSANGLGYARIPGLFTPEQVAGWKLTTAAVHARGAKIFPQIMHCGRIAHPLNQPKGARVVAPSAVKAAGDMWTDSEGMKPLPEPEAMTEADIKQAIEEFVTAAKNAVAAGFDGIELHAANGYLLEQFLRPNSNVRRDGYGGTTEKRARFVFEVADAAIRAVGKDKVGIRISPFGTFNDMPVYPEMEADYSYLVSGLNERGLLYIHVVDHSAQGAPKIPDSMKATIRRASNCHVILSGGYDLTRAEADLKADKADVIAVGKPILANPDLVKRWQSGATLNTPDSTTFYTPGPKGYTDYPALG